MNASQIMPQSLEGGGGGKKIMNQIRDALKSRYHEEDPKKVRNGNVGPQKSGTWYPQYPPFTQAM